MYIFFLIISLIVWCVLYYIFYRLGNYNVINVINDFFIFVLYYNVFFCVLFVYCILCVNIMCVCIFICILY